MNKPVQPPLPPHKVDRRLIAPHQTHKAVEPLLLMVAALALAAIGISIYVGVESSAARYNLGLQQDVLSKQEKKLTSEQVSSCLDRNGEHRIISKALQASLLEADVQANKPQRLAYEKIVQKFSAPEDCTP